MNVIENQDGIGKVITDKSAYFQKNMRLLKADEFSRVFKNPLRSSDCYLTILAVPALTSSDLTDSALIETGRIPHARLGLAISKKNAKRAVDRNRIKRLIRESFRLNQFKLPAIDLVVMAKPITKSADNQKIVYSLEQHWNRLIKQCAKFSSE